jgi:type IV secretory pathway VirJ component
MLGKVAMERLSAQEKINEELSRKSKELERKFGLAESTNLELEKKVSELAEALKRSQDEKKFAEATLEDSKKELEKVRKSHEDDLSVIEKLRQQQERASKIAEDLRTNNANLAKSLSSKDQKIVDLEKALKAESESSKKQTSEILGRLRLLYAEYQKSLNEYGVRPAPLPDDIDIPDFMDWLEEEFKALHEVIDGAGNFAVSFSVESILKVLHEYGCADLAKFRANLSQFPGVTSEAILQDNPDVIAIKQKFAKEFWMVGGAEMAKTVGRLKLDEVILWPIS